MDSDNAHEQADSQSEMRLVDDVGPVAEEARPRRLRAATAGAVDPFFDERREQSHIKTDIVVKYLDAWAKIMVERRPHFKASYIDLFAGSTSEFIEQYLNIANSRLSVAS